MFLKIYLKLKYFSLYRRHVVAIREFLDFEKIKAAIFLVQLYCDDICHHSKGDFCGEQIFALRDEIKVTIFPCTILLQRHVVAIAEKI